MPGPVMPKAPLGNFFCWLILLFVPASHGADTLPGETGGACAREAIENFNHIQLAPEEWFTADRPGREELSRRVRDIEADEGVYSYNLVPQLLGLGLLVQEQQDHATAASVFERALYIVRANNGLYSPYQLAILDRVIESNSALGDWEKVADSYDLMHWLYRRNFGKDDPRQLKTLKRLRRWYMESYNKDTGRSLEELFNGAETTYEAAIRIMWRCTGGNERETLCFWHRGCCDAPEHSKRYCPLDTLQHRNLSGDDDPD